VSFYNSSSLTKVRFLFAGDVSDGCVRLGWALAHSPSFFQWMTKTTNTGENPLEEIRPKKQGEVKKRIENHLLNLK
jgi:hypothetical protein